MVVCLYFKQKLSAAALYHNNIVHFPSEKRDLVGQQIKDITSGRDGGPLYIAVAHCSHII